MRSAEKRVMIASVIAMVALPVGGELYGMRCIFQNTMGIVGFFGMGGIVIAPVLTFWQFIYVITNQFCTRCVDFPCPLNQVPDELIKKYL
jgi:hypothetical protein